MVGKGGMLPGVDKNLEGMEDGEEKTFDLPPEDAFGRIDDAPRKPIPRNEFPSGVPLEIGAAFEAGMGGGQTIKLEVVEVTDEVVTVRMVHPLAGKTLSMTARIVTVREPTAKEVEAGRALTKPPPPPPKG
jgi:FKBP-type peptidyl-prolyl cis-trans isomerase 2